jgi:hypothetical protein
VVKWVDINEKDESTNEGNAMGSGTAEFARHLPFYRCVSSLVLWLRKSLQVTEILRFA